MPQSPNDQIEAIPQLRIVIPACNEAARIEPTLTDYCAEFTADARIVVVANGCADATATVAGALCRRYSNLEVVDVSARIGKGGAVRMGLASGQEPFAGFVDADGSTSAREFRRLFETLRGCGSDVVIGSRWSRGSVVKHAQPLRRRLASRAFNALVSILFGLRFRDTQCGAKIFTRDALLEVLPALELADYAFDIELLWRLKQNSRIVREEPTVWQDRAGSRVDLARVPWTMFTSIVRLRLQESPLWRIPMVDRVGRGGLIPVRPGRSILVLRRTDDSRAERLFESLQKRGLQVLFADEEARRSGFRLKAGSLHPWRGFLWYALASRRQYDGILEFDSDPPSWLAQLSSKPRFRLRLSEGGELNAAEGGSVTAVSLRSMSAEELAALIDTITVARLPYRAVLVKGTSLVSPDDLPRAIER